MVTRTIINMVEFSMNESFTDRPYLRSAVEPICTIPRNKPVFEAQLQGVFFIRRRYCEGSTFAAQALRRQMRLAEQKAHFMQIS
ncbi:Hypothetical protein RG1141_CH23680 [Neorhizobium galegae bv. officinalis bv. officinalis str. HAMBI 1141]|uniref:Uncharacterized protein n=1 Tax=Neorhizobium galegae bv. officinalis bv. officinalis str. HAMBI 1141 TaxID=1028801 RepID=A0A068T9J9_NEOGA|nr:Hypothetical protein RG1141_CH23680 [Neorhizobium galegae bv. officinalis bv. officinalis str. HAMBI 1141]